MDEKTPQEQFQDERAKLAVKAKSLPYGWQTKCSKLTGISNSRISDILRGATQVSRDQFDTLKRAIDLIATETVELLSQP